MRDLHKALSRAARRRQRSADNEFTKLSGLEAVQLTGKCDCLVTKQKHTRGMSITKYAYLAYNNMQGAHPKRVKRIRVFRTCGVDQCVKKEHLKAYDPLKDTPPGCIW